jgi:hypothetical protein
MDGRQQFGEFEIMNDRIAGFVPEIVITLAPAVGWAHGLVGSRILPDLILIKLVSG